MPSSQAFPDTSWGMVSRFQDSPHGDYRAGLETLCGRYWKPVFYYLRAAWAKSEEDARDLTQAFLLWLLEGEALKRYAPDRGSFRTFLKVLLGHFVQHEDAAARRLKRGGGTRLIRLEDSDRPLKEVIPDRNVASPEEILDERWVTLLMERAVDRVRRAFLAGGREPLFRVFEAYDLAPDGEPPTYASVGARLGLRDSQVRDYLYVVRQAVRQEVRAELAQLTRDDRELEEEWNALFRDDERVGDGRG